VKEGHEWKSFPKPTSPRNYKKKRKCEKTKQKKKTVKEVQKGMEESVEL